jgi:nucleotide-binding universal stress UspA family protein
VAEQVVRHAPGPVLTFRPGVAPAKRLVRSILVPHDLSTHAGRAMKLAAALAGPEGRLIVLHVVAGDASRKGAQRRLSRLVARTSKGRRAPSVDCRVETGDPYRRIARAARDADAIVMCTAGRTGLPHLVIGSVAEKVVRHAPVPVLTIRPRVARASRAAASRMRQSA